MNAVAPALWPNGGLSTPIYYRDAPSGFRWTSAFGWRTHPVTGQRETFHYGLDLIGWTTIVAPVAGVVTFAGYNGAAGYEVRIREDGTGDVFRLLHNRELWVRSGQRVTQGQGVAIMGTTGSSTGVHCHEETRPGGGAAIDPLVYYRNRNSAAAAGGGVPFQEEEEMLFVLNITVPGQVKTVAVVPQGSAKPRAVVLYGGALDEPSTKSVPIFTVNSADGVAQWRRAVDGL